ncbi:MAG TPA: class I SAM-dependent methyltransferase [Candidatus Saccharimonadales bacterium]|nr:class I SAM-dependent methyltransferase [Candidatus Saccharimonadales bacterium]
MDTHYSKSEENGIATIPADALNIYSVGVSTVGDAEIRMAKLNPSRKIIATTIDKKGAESAKKYIDDQSFNEQIQIKIEDVTTALPYPDNFFDFVYARLVLHYLPKSGLETALASLYRILKHSGKFYIVVRSTKAENFSESTATYDDTTGFTTFLSKSDPTVKKQRFFHTPESITSYVTAAGFQVEYVKEYDEEIYTDFNREGRISKEPLIELLALKP